MTFGARLARGGPMASISLVLSVLTSLVMCGLAFVLAARGDEAPVHDVPLLASTVLAWGGGVLLAFSASASAFHRDRVEGIRHLFVMRTMSLRAYVVSRTSGLVAVLASVVGGGTLVVGAVSILVASRAHLAVRTVQATVAAVAYSFAFAIVVAPIALATLGARTRATGYALLLAVLVVPELMIRGLGGSLPDEVTELCAVPTALAAFRSSLSPGGLDPSRFVRTSVALAIFVAIAVVFLDRDVVRKSGDVA